MSVNKHVPHVYVIPEDREDAQIANGFIEHHQVKARYIQIMPPAGGWEYVLKVFKEEYIRYLINNASGYVVLLVDFDEDYARRRQKFAEAIPEDLRERVFVLGAVDTPETLKRELKSSPEKIGLSLAEDCWSGKVEWWNRHGLAHNEPDRRRLFEKIRPFLFSF